MELHLPIDDHEHASLSQYLYGCGVRRGEPISIRSPNWSGPEQTLKFTDGTSEREVRLAEPFLFLGSGAEKVVVSAVCKGGLEGFEQISDNRRVAIGFARDHGWVMHGLDSYRLVRDLGGFPTYPWYLQTLDGQACLMPDLSSLGQVYSSNFLDNEWFTAHKIRIDDQLGAILRRAVAVKPAIRINYDTYFIVDTSNGPLVLLGDFDSTAPRADYGSLASVELKNMEHTAELFHWRFRLVLALQAAMPSESPVRFASPEPEKNPDVLYRSLVNCDAGVGDPRIFYQEFFVRRGTSLEAVLAQADAKVRDLFDINVRGFLGEDI